MKNPDALPGGVASSVPRKHSLQPLIKVKQREEGAKSVSRGVLSPYKDKPDIAKKIMERSAKRKFAQLALQQSSGAAAIRFQDTEASSPSRTYFPSHMSQTLNSKRRQSKYTISKNQDAYDKEEQVKTLMRRIKQKRMLLLDLNKDN